MTRDIRFVDVRSTFYSQNYCNVRSWPHSICAQCYSPFIDFVHAALNSTVCVEILQCGWSLFIEACSGYASETHILWAVVVFSSSSSSSLVLNLFAGECAACKLWLLPVLRHSLCRRVWHCWLSIMKVSENNTVPTLCGCCSVIISCRTSGTICLSCWSAWKMTVKLLCLQKFATLRLPLTWPTVNRFSKFFL